MGKVQMGYDTTPPPPQTYMLDMTAFNQMMDQPTLLTPDALMSFCESRLRGIDTQVQSAFAKQNAANADSQLLSSLENSIMLPTEDSIDLSKNDTLKSVNMGARDYVADLISKLTTTANAISDPTARAALLQQADALKQDLDNGTTVHPDDIKRLSTDAIGKIQTDLNTGAELSMINLQALMGQRQEAIQVCTNLVQALGDQLNKIADNVGK